MSDLVGNPEDRFSRVEAHLSSDVYIVAIDARGSDRKIDRNMSG